MFLSACRQVAKEFPEITYDEDLLDRVCLQVGTPNFTSKRAADWRSDRSCKTLSRTPTV